MHLICIHLLEILNTRTSLKGSAENSFHVISEYDTAVCFAGGIICNSCFNVFSLKTPDLHLECNTFSEFMGSLYNQSRANEIIVTKNSFRYRKPLEAQCSHVHFYFVGPG